MFSTSRLTNFLRKKAIAISKGFISRNWAFTSWENHNQMQILPVPALSDNFMYIIVDDATKECAVVDPVEPKKVLEVIKSKGLNLTSALVTHHHWDHAGGNKELLSLVPAGLAVLGGDRRIDGMTRQVGHDDAHAIGGLQVRCLFTPCHTTGHICYFVTGPGAAPPAVFTGDTLFLGGCGRFFEGTAEQMYRALVTVLGALPGETRVYCGHEYAVRNLEFGLYAEPDNADIAAKLEWARAQAAAKEHSVPSTIDGEKRFNVFMRVDEPSMRRRLNCADGVKAMHTLREMKNKF